MLLTGPVRRSDDARFRDLAFELIERLKNERIILITKAISWLLRSLVAHHRQAVLRYLDVRTARDGETLRAIILAARLEPVAALCGDLPVGP